MSLETRTRPSDDPEIVRRTQRLDVVRSVPAGVVYPLESSVLLTILITRFDAAGWVKGLVAAAAGAGLVLSPVVTALARRSARPTMVIAAAISLLGAGGFLLAAAGPLAAFVVGSIVGVATVSAAIPLITSVYERNFPAAERGTRVGWGMTVRVAVSALAGLAMGSFLTASPDRWWVLLVVGAAAMMIVAWSQATVPSAPLPPVDGRHRSVLPHFELLAEDRRLRLTIIAWMFMGFGNLMLLPLRVEYLARPGYGIEADAAKITLLTVTIPSVVRLVCMPLFGRVFDRMSFFASRITVNLLFTAYVVAFFSGTSTVGLVAGAVTFGVAAAGGDLLWFLWVTKFAPPERVADYMGLHTFFTGLRAITAPVLAFVVVGRVDLWVIALGAAALMTVSSALLVPEARLERRAATAA